MLFGLFFNGLHHQLESAVPAAEIVLCRVCSRDLVYADDVCLLAASPGQLQALIDALAAYFGTLHMEIQRSEDQSHDIGC